MEVKLTFEEMCMGSIIGCIRLCESKSLGRKDSHGASQSFEADCGGALAEFAYCKFRNQHWSGSIGSFKMADVGKNVQIRYTHRDNGCLIIREPDDPNHFFVLVTGIPPNFNIQGWIKGVDGKRAEYLRNPNGRESAYFVPQDRLIKFLDSNRYIIK